MSTKLFAQAVGKFLLGIVLVAALIFLPAGTFRFWNAWLLIACLFAPMLAVGVVLLVKNPSLLKSRLNAKEKQREQDFVVKVSGLMFLLGFLVSGLGVRFGWYVLPKTVSFAAAVLLLFSYGLYAFVLKENAYLSRTIEVQEHQTVVDTGLYRYVRHPMYSATILLFLSMPLVLGSLYALLIFMAYPIIICVRIKHEEKFLEVNLDGYSEYKKKVKYRLIPFVW